MAGRNVLGWLGGGLVVAGLVALLAGGGLGGPGIVGGPSSMMGAGGWMGPGMMGAWGGGSLGQAPSAEPSGTTASPAADTIRMNGARFSPAQLTVAAGTAVTWINDDDEPHTVTAADRSWSSGNMAPGATYTRSFATGGTYSYVCLYHPWMQATVTVR